MLSIFADALMIAARIGRLPDSSRNRRPSEDQDLEAWRTLDTLRHPLR